MSQLNGAKMNLIILDAVAFFYELYHSRPSTLELGKIYSYAINEASKNLSYDVNGINNFVRNLR
jgi:hypothetical protein